MVPALRIRALNAHPVRKDGRFVVYWMTAARRSTWNFALDRALEHSRALQKPLVVVEALRCGHRWASDRFHAFVIAGMRDNAAAFARANIAYHAYVEPTAGAGKGMIEALAKDACVVVTDDYPCFFLPKMAASLAARVRVCVEDVDGNGVLPMRAAGTQVFPTAFAFRRFLQKELPKHLTTKPNSTLDASTLPMPTLSLPKWPSSLDAPLSSLPIDHSVAPIDLKGGSVAAQAHLRGFIERRLAGYHEDRSGPDKDGQSGLSPWLHWGHLSAWEVVDAVFRKEAWTPDKASRTTSGSREGWWGLSTSAEGFLDELITWREIGFNFTSRRADYDSFESLPAWAQKTLHAHANDAREHVYSIQQLIEAKTHDPLWNAAQKQLMREGIIQNYLRMLWGKKILEWSPTPEAALAAMLELNNRFAIDGRDPNSYSGIFWVLGRYDRPWGPERSVFGLIRYMSSLNTAKKHDVDLYLARYGEKPEKAPKKKATPKQATLL